jgi:hypothetical protein
MMRDLNLAVLDGTPSFLFDEQLDEFMERESQNSDTNWEWCPNKIPASDFDVYRLGDFYTLWFLYLIFLALATGVLGVKTFLRLVKSGWFSQEIFNGREKANSYILNSTRNGFCIWTTFSVFFC